MTQNNYYKIVTKIANVTKTVAVNDILENVGDDVVDTSVSCDGSWRKRGYSSLNGVFTAISTDRGKIKSVEEMILQNLLFKKDLIKTDPTYAEWRNSHVCKFNYKGL